MNVALVPLLVQALFGGARFTESDWHVAPGVCLGAALTPRLSIASDLSYLYASESDRDVLLVPRLFYDLKDPGFAVPYLTGGIGVLWHRDLVGYGPEGPPALRPYWSTDVWAGGGAGVRFPIRGGFGLGAEVQVAYPLVVHLGVRLHFR